MRKTTSHTDKPAASKAAQDSAHPAAAIARTTGAMVRASGDLQETMARRAGLLQQEAAHQLRMATNPAELVAVQTALMMAGWQHSIQWTSDLANAWFALGTAGATPYRDPKPH
ncbi:hypothetical protein [Ramlibacter humi]|uniref:Phasin domain-containing protein n=1 Tax=Ramlibacter humi TaxID=2530451 RepID=A0A4Z0CA63_9BURK|nr:hypothetical protein [Ramlibacter humi]TFZ07884.1 hypothetical protein EZ216_01595 [Ramlibacter humi]